MLGVEHDNARKLMTVPGIGPLIASAIVAAIAYILNSAKRDRQNEAQAAHRMKSQPKYNMHRLY
jgi:Holliday junction resolvasome RuvABC DNA-binding subunit